MVTQIVADGLVLANAVEYTDWQTDRIQLLVCEHCGVEHCERGNWVAVRSAGEYVLIIPAFTDLLGSDDDWIEYQPPPIIKKRGSIVLDANGYDTLRSIANELPVKSAVVPLQSAEIARVLQWEAPGRILGDLRGNPTVERKALVAASHGEVHEWIEVVQRALVQLWKENTAVSLRPVTGADTVIELYLDIDNFPAWKAVVRQGSQLGLYLEPGLVTPISELAV